MGKSTVIPFGPQHPVLPEPLHLDLVVQDETVIDCLPQIGFVHRGLEKLVETRDYNQFIYVAERICGICAMGHSLGYAETVESLMGVEVPKRAEYLRVIWHELSRIHSHLLWLGLAADAFGFESMFMHCWRLRERILDIFEKTTGGRVILSVVRVGGVNRDIEDSELAAICQVLDGIKSEYKEIMDTLLTDMSVKNRTVGVGHISLEQANDLSMVGPFGRASGLGYDVRTFGKGAYGELSEFQPITDTQGDCYARVKVRCEEVLQSIGIIEELSAKIPAGDISVKVKGNPEDGARASNVLEQPRGECYYYAEGNGTKFLERMRMRTPTSQNLAGMVSALKGCDLADVNMIILTIDPCISCTER
ncbi:MAG: NADH-quinone oxidoreductase subunit D [Eggerthellaceae bacterium]|nr:NADH-quinone oxidoreductase subunit D [Eggerthellaceae bacterium]